MSTHDPNFDPTTIPYTKYFFIIMTIVGAVYLLTGPLQNFVSATLNVATTPSSAVSSLSDGLVAHWTFDGSDVRWQDTSSEFKDRTGNSLHANAYLLSTDDVVAGVVGQGMSFNGTTQSALVSDANELSFTDGSGNDTTFSISTWLLLPSLDSIVLAKAPIGAGDREWYLYIDSSGNVIMKLCEVAANCTDWIQSEASTYSLDTNTWYHVTVVYDGSETASGIRIFVNAIARDDSHTSNGTYTGMSNGTANVGIAVWSDNFAYGDVTLDDTRIYDRELSNKEIERLYQMGEGVKIATTPTLAASDSLNNGLVGHWTFDGPDVDWSSTTAEILDVSGNSHHGDATSTMTQASIAGGYMGQAVAKNTFIEIPDSDDFSFTDGSDNDQPFAFSFWVRDPDGGSGGVYFDKDENPSVTYAEWALYLDLLGAKWAATLNVLDGDFPGGDVQSIHQNTELAGTHWSHVVFQYSGAEDVSSFSVYINGDEVAQTGSDSSGYSGMSNKSRPVKITTYGNAMVDDIRIYDRELTISEITRLYQMGEGTKIATTIKTPGSPLEQGLVGHWTFDGMDVDWGSSTAEIKDVSGNGNHGDAINGMSTRSVTPGRLGQGMSFDGVNDYVNAPNSSTSVNLSKTFTIGVWVQHNDFADGSNPDWADAYVSNVIDNSDSRGYSIENRGTGRNKNPALTVKWADSTKTELAGTTEMQAGVWYHVVGVGDNSTLRLYINGIEENSVDVTSKTWPTLVQGLKLGTFRPDRFFFNGSLDDVRIYNRALSAKEVEMLYQLGR